MLKESKYIIDAHAHYGYWKTLSSVERMLCESTDKNNVNFTLLSFDGSEFFTMRGDHLTSSMHGSKKSLALCQKYPKKFGFLIWVRPNTEKNAAEIDAFIAKHRNMIYGIKYHPWCSQLRINSQKALPFIELARKYNLPVLVHTANDKFSKLKYLERLMDEFPDVTFVAAHCVLESDHEEIIGALKKYPNLYCDTAWVHSSFISRIKEEGLMDRIMFGTDNPIDGFETLDEEIYQDYFNNKMELSKKDYEALMYKNALRVYKIDPKTFK